MSFSLLAALALFVNACERHAANETKDAIKDDLGAKPLETSAAAEPASDTAPAKAAESEPPTAAATDAKADKPGGGESTEKPKRLIDSK